jgi:AcrR family transcriptional regulator
MPRRSAADARRTRDAIVDRAVQLAATDGLEGLTFGRLAADLQMSKAGVVGHFTTKEALQLAALDQAVAHFTDTVWRPAAEHEPGLPRLAAIVDAWMAYLDADALSGGCFLTAASTEFDGREGPVRDAVAATWARWRDVLRAEARAAGLEDPAQVAFELLALAVGANHERQLHGDRGGPRRARRAMRRVLGLT